MENPAASNQEPTHAPASALKITAIAYAGVKNILERNTCLACHNPTKKQVGPSYAEIAKRKYTIAKIISLIRNPQPENWPGYSTPMPPMPQVSDGCTKNCGIY